MKIRSPFPPPLLSSLVVVLCAYHLFNLFHPERFRAALRWKRSQITVRNGSQELARFPVWMSTPNLDARIDASSQVLATAVGTVRFLVGEEEDLFQLETSQESRSYRRYDRADISTQFPRGPEWVKTHFIEPLRNWAKPLERAGIPVVLLPVPTKVAVLREFLSQTPLPVADVYQLEPQRIRQNKFPPREDFYADYGTLVHSDPKNFIDLYTYFREQLRTNPEKPYLKLNNHCSPYGQALIAQAIARQLIVMGKAGVVSPEEGLLAPPLIKKTSKRNWVDFENGQGLLLFNSFLNSSWFDHTETEYQVGKIQLSPEIKRVIYLGSSFSFMSLRISDLLEAMWDRPLIAETDLGYYHFAPQIERINSTGFTLEPGDFVIAEFPFSYPWKPGEEIPSLNLSSEDFPVL